MQLDIFVYDPAGPRFAIEVEGKQHEERQFFQTKEEFQYLIQCDKLKERMLIQKKIRLFKIPPGVETMEQLKLILREVLP